jgi:hypothetical protein
MESQDSLISDVVMAGVLNLAAMYIAQKLYPNSFALQAFVSGSIFHLSMKMIEAHPRL